MFIRFGTVKESEPGKVKVLDIENDCLTDWMPVISSFFGQVKSLNWKLATEEKVVFIEDDSGRGVVLGQHPDSDVPAADPGSNIILKVGSLAITVSSALFQVGSGALYLVRADKAETKIGSLIDAINLHTHASAAPGSPTGVPLNAADFTALKSEISGGALRTEKIKGL